LLLTYLLTYLLLNINSITAIFSRRCCRAMRIGDAYRYTIQPIYDNLTDSVSCHIRRRRPSSSTLFDLFYFVEVTSRRFRSPIVRRRVTADAILPDGGGRRGSVVVDYLGVEFDVGLDLADEFILRASDLAEAQIASGDQTATGTVWNMSSDDQRRSPHFRVHELAQSAAFVTSVRPRRPFEVSTVRWRRPSPGAADSAAASCDMSSSQLLSADDVDDVYSTPGGQHLQAVKAVIQERSESDRTFRYYVMSADSPPYFRFTIPGRPNYKTNMSITIIYTMFSARPISVFVCAE